MKLSKYLLLPLLLATLLLSPPIAGYTVPVVEVGGNLYSNVLNQAQNWLNLGSQYTQQYQQWEALVNSYQNLETLLEPVDREIGSLIWNSGQLLQQEGGLVYTDVDISSEFEDLFPGWTLDTSLSTENHHERQNSRLDTARAVLLTLFKNQKNSVNSQYILDDMKHVMAGTKGDLEAEQAAAYLQTFTAEETSRTALLLGLMTNLQAVEIAEKAHREAARIALFDNWIAEQPPTFREYHEYPGWNITPY